MDVNLVAIASARQLQLQLKVGNCLSIQRAGQEALVSAWLWLLPLPLTLLGGQSSNQHRMRRLPRTLVTGLHPHTCCSQLWPLQHAGNSQLSYY